MKNILSFVLILKSLTGFCQYIEIQKIWNPTSPGSDFFGYDIESHGNRCVIAGNGEHYAEVREFNGTQWEFVQTLYSMDVTGVHSVCMNDEFVFFGKPYEDEDAIPSDFDAGYVYIYRWNGEKYYFFQKIFSPFGTIYDYFGADLKVENNRFIASLNHTDYIAATYIFNGTEWVLEQLITTEYSTSTYTMDLNGDYLFFGLSEHTVGAFTQQGIVLKFIFDGTSWVEDGYLTASDGNEYDKFGNALFPTEDKIIIAAENAGPGATYNGAAYIFELIGGEWVETAKIVSPLGGAEAFGTDVEIEGDKCFVSGTNELYFAAVFYFKKIAGVWTYQQTLTISDYTEYDNYGEYIQIAANTILGTCDRAQNYGSEPGYRGAVYVHYLCEPISSTTSHAICEGDNYLFGGSTLTTAGTYVDSLNNFIGCDSISTLILSVISIDTNLLFTDTSLIVSETEGTYQWYNCSTNNIMPGETNNYHVPEISGTYSCIINKSGCVDTTICSYFEVISCYAPISSNVINITSSSAKITWPVVPSATKYQVQYRPTGTLAWYTVNALSNSKTISSLLSNQSYDYRIKTICDALSSDFTAILTFVTLP